jgi:hypothetical protein
MQFRVIDGCPCPASIAPYVYIVLRDAGQTASSIYRGADAAALLHAHGKSTQAEIHLQLPRSATPPGSPSTSFAATARATRTSRAAARCRSGRSASTPAATTRLQGAHRVGGAQERLEGPPPLRPGRRRAPLVFRDRPRPRGLKQRARIIHLRATLPRR